MIATTQLVPIGGYYKRDPRSYDSVPFWVTDHWNVRLTVGAKIVRQESFRCYETAQAYCRWLDQGLTLAGNNSTGT